MCQMSWYNTNLVDIQLSGLFFSYRIQNENKNTSEGHESENNTEPNLSEIRTIYKRISTGQINCKQNINTDVKKVIQFTRYYYILLIAYCIQL